MKAMLTSALGGSIKVNGTRIPDVLIRHNGLLDRLKSIWIPNARVLIICANPDNHEKNDENGRQHLNELCHDFFSFVFQALPVIKLF